MPWGEIEETVFWVAASGLGVSGGEVIGMEKTRGYTICSEDAPFPPKMIVVAPGPEQRVS